MARQPRLVFRGRARLRISKFILRIEELQEWTIAHPTLALLSSADYANLTTLRANLTAQLARRVSP
jgi:hypothetical protein